MKIKRHDKIRELISKFDIETQEELAERLNMEGFNVTQATVSRDIRELKLTKMPNGRGRQCYTLLKKEEDEMKDKYIRIFCDGFVSFDFYDILFYILSKSQKGTEPFLHIRSVVLVLFSYGRYCVF